MKRGNRLGVKYLRVGLGRTQEAAEECICSRAARKGAIENAAVTVRLKAYPDTNRRFFRSLLERGGFAGDQVKPLLFGISL